MYFLDNDWKNPHVIDYRFSKFQAVIVFFIFGIAGVGLFYPSTGFCGYITDGLFKLLTGGGLIMSTFKHMA